MNAETVAEIRRRHVCIIEIKHEYVDVELPPLPAGFASE
jgi:hypothetical protein